LEVIKDKISKQGITRALADESIEEKNYYSNINV
jgi:hypothetical protein